MKKRFLTIFISLFFIGINYSLAFADSPMSNKLWQGISNEDVILFKKITSSLESGNYDKALNYAAEIKYNRITNEYINKEKPGFAEAISDIILWYKFSNDKYLKNTSFSDISRFINDNPFYPNINNLKRNVEKVAVDKKPPYQSSQRYFQDNPAQNLESKLYLLESKIEFLSRMNPSQDETIDLRKDIQQEISKIWIEENFSAEEENIFLNKYQKQLIEEDFIKRIERLLFKNKISDAKRIINFVNDDYRKLFLAIIKLENLPKYINNIILSVPRKLRSNELLSYQRVAWYRLKGKIDDLVELMEELPKNSAFPDEWIGLRKLYAREVLKEKKYKTAYNIIAFHNLPTNHSDYWEAEWTAGWIALRFLKEPKVAYKHFENLHNHVVQPVSLARSSYWLGMASQAMKDDDEAIKWYKFASKYPTFFYGQLAIHKHRLLDPIGARSDIILPGDPEITKRDLYNISHSRAAQVAYILGIIGDKKNSKEIFEWLISNSPTEGQVAVIMKIVNEFKDQELDASIARAAAKKNVFFIKDKFQIVKAVSNDEYAPLVHAIIKQESGFAPSAVSKVGALGFMQIMPQTARLISKELGIKYSKYKLARNIDYNIKLGSFYIKKLINQFEGSEMLAIASYNAGPNATKRWIKEFYDPRKEKDIDKVVDWIELITYSETRNYVQRITENLIVYKYLMSRANYDNIQ